MDPITIGLLAGAGLGMLQGDKNEKKMYRDGMLKAELAKYAPYSDVAKYQASQEVQQLPDQTASIASGAFKGGQAGSLMSKAGPWSGMQADATVAAPDVAAQAAPVEAPSMQAPPTQNMEQLTPDNMNQMELIKNQDDGPVTYNNMPMSLKRYLMMNQTALG